MRGIPNPERQRLGALLEQETQETVMAKIPQFAEAETENWAPAPAAVPEQLGILVFNMERGVHLEELGDFLQDCPDIRPLDVVLANELDDGCVRSGGRNTARELAERFGWNYAYGLEFIELVDERNEKGFHGNAVFSRWPIRRAGVIRLPEQYNWYFDRQRRIGGRLAVFAELDVGGRPLGVVSIHLENRTHGAGRQAQMAVILEAVDRELAGMPVILGGDLNTNTFDGRSKEDIGDIAGSPELRRRWLSRHYNFDNPLSIAAAQSAYEAGEPWLEALRAYLDGNFSFTAQYLARELPHAKFRVSEATYLAWVDLSAYFAPDEQLPLFFAYEAGVLLEGGNMFVQNSDGFIRLNLACPRAILEEGLRRICQAVNTRHTGKYLGPA